MSRSICPKVSIDPFFAKENFRFYSFFYFFIHEAGRKRFATKRDGKAISHTQVIEFYRPGTIPIDTCTQNATIFFVDIDISEIFLFISLVISSLFLYLCFSIVHFL